uniref:Kinesin motor domain-containing protein n=1 Tax=Callorhinchus milii TaxID=7868 RepID=A0A4W3GNR7_CALMI
CPRNRTNRPKTTVRVVVRCRPSNSREKELSCREVVTMDPGRGQCFIHKPTAPEQPPKHFTFDGVFSVITDGCVLLQGVTEGYNGTIFAYGQTGSGKSFTMQGVSYPPSQRGVIPRAFEHIFEKNAKFLVRASFLEIYNEEIHDLLGQDTKQKLELKEHPERGVYVKDLSMHTVHSVAECERIMNIGWSNRAVETTYNPHLSSPPYTLLIPTPSSGENP